MDKNSGLAVGIDIGSHVVRCVVGRIDEEDGEKPTIIGVGSVASVGVRKGQVVEPAKLAERVDEAVALASQMAGAEISNATININGSHLISINSQGTIAINSEDGIDFDELERVEEAARLVKMPENREIIQLFAQMYYVDGQATKNPIGMQGVRLEIDSHIVTSSRTALRALSETTEAADVYVNNLLLPAVAVSNLVASKQQRENGVAIVDIGGATTNIAVYEEQDLLFVSSIPVGGNNITNDLAIGLQIDLDLAEELKVNHVDITEDITGYYELGDEEDRRFSKKEVHKIVRSRLDDIFELINKDLNQINKSRSLPGGVVFVGGGAKLRGIDELAKKRLSLPASVGNIEEFGGINDCASDPAWASVIGLMNQDGILGNNHVLEGRNQPTTNSRKFRRSAKKTTSKKSKKSGSKSSPSSIKSFIDRFK